MAHHVKILIIIFITEKKHSPQANFRRRCFSKATTIISDDLVDAASIGFVGKCVCKEDSLSSFTADDLKIDSLMNECMGGDCSLSRESRRDPKSKEID
ncbi:MAG: hypothetical protein IPL67_17730 [Ignavibacteria bacterium]|nr:hypothetical protein [Ignavibacteria bacterium]